MKPSHPGEIIKWDYLEPLKLTVGELAEAVGVTRSTMSAVINGRSAVSPDMALRLAQAFDTTADLWIGMQRNHDLFVAKQKYNPKRVIRKVYSSTY